MSLPSRAFLLCWLILGAGLARETQAATLTVTSLADTGPGTLRAQVAAADPGDTIVFSVTGTIQLLAPAISIAKNLTITGPGAGSLTVAGNVATSGGGNNAPIFLLTDGVVGLSGLTLRDGTGNLLPYDDDGTPTFANFGGAIYVSGGTATVTACTFTANHARFGGALCVASGGTATVTGSAFSNNDGGDEGGAIYLRPGASLSLVGSTLTGHAPANFGGAINVAGGSLSVSSCTVSGNSARFGGGLAAASSSTVTIANSTFSGNTALQPGLAELEGIGGGIFSVGDLTITNSTFSGNIAQGRNSGSDPGGGGIYHFFGNLTIIGCTITGNVGDYGAGLRSRGPLMYLANTIIAGNTGVIEFDSNGGTDLYNFIGGDPMLAPLAHNGGPTQTHRPLPFSPVLDAGDPNFNATNTPYDQRGPGFPRVKNGRVCIGAFESEQNQSGNTFVVTSLDDHDDGIAGMSDCTLREAVSAAPAGATIIFGVAGTITLTGGELAIAKNLTIQGPATAPGVTISGNNASRIFGISQSAPTVTVNLSYLTLTGGNGVGSLSSGGGGAISADSLAALNVTNCTLTGNTATNGGGGAIRSVGPLTVTNSTLNGNTATGGTPAGGAIRAAQNLSVSNCTIVGNSSATNGGGIFKGTAAGTTFTLANSIVAGNTAPTGPDVGGTVNAGDYNLIQNPAGVTLSGTHNLTGSAPQLGALADNGGPTWTMPPLTGSPVLNAGSNALIPNGLTTDQRGAPRIDSGTVDLGAVEVDATPPTVTLNQAAGQTDPTISTPVHFTVVFSEPVTGFTGANVTLSGTAGATTAVVTGSGTTYDIAVSGLTRSGTVQATLAAGVALDVAGNASVASTSTDNAVYFYSAEEVQRSGRIQAAVGGGYDVSFLGNPGQEYTIQFTSALTLPWQTLRTQTAAANGVIAIVDQPPMGTEQGFYRLYVP